MKNKNSIKYLFLWFLLLLVSYPGLAQQRMFSGTITDKNGNPVADALVTVKERPSTKVFTDNEGRFNILGEPGELLTVTTNDNLHKSLVLEAEQIALTIENSDELIPVGHRLEQHKGEITSAIGVVRADELSKSSVYNPANALYGKIPGLTVLQNGGTSWNNAPDLYIRGVETFGIGDFVNTNILVLVDGFERPISSLSLAEIENVAILKDAAALAMYGLRGANGVMLVTTKKGNGQGLSVNAGYEHGITQAFRIPEFLDAYGYASALNQAYVNDGGNPYYSAQELSRFQSGTSPFLYPNINWLDEGLRDFGSTDQLHISFQEQASSVRYFGLMNFYNEEGLLGPVNENEGYTTQINNFKINLRTNFQIDLTRTTRLTANIAGNIGQGNRPSTPNDENDVFEALYSTTSAAFPIKTYNDEWGGTTTFPDNPMAMISGIGYSVRGQNELMVDLLVEQSLDDLVKGLSAEAGISFDNSYNFLDVKNRQYQYQELTPILESGVIIDTVETIYGTNTALEFSTEVPYQWRRFSAVGNLKHVKTWGDNQLNSILLLQSEQLVLTGQHNTYRHLLAAGNFHYSKAGKYFADLSWSYNGTNLLPKGSRAGFFPAVSVAWKLSEEDWLSGSSMVDYLKLRASFGMTGNDQVIQNISASPWISGSGYRYGSNNSGAGGYTEGRLASSPLTYETSYKSNIGIDANLFGMLDINLDAFYNKREGILVQTQGSIAGVMGVELPYASSGSVKNMGAELGLNLYDNTGDLTYHLGGYLSYAKNEILDMLEVYRPYDYLKRTGQSVHQAFGLEAIGFFSNESDISNSPEHSFSIVRPGDIKYKDQNNDDVINDFDEVPIGYSTQNPELYFSGSVGIAYKGLGVEALVQGIANMTMYLNTPSIFWPLRGNNNISSFSNDAWTPSTASTATLPGLTLRENANNFRPNTVWYADASYLKLRSVELYYKLPNQLISRLGLNETTLYVRGMNLLSFDEIEIIDPEAIGLVYPTLMTFNIGIKIGF